MGESIRFTYLVHGRRALFSDPITRIGGEKMSYQVPTYQAIKGITESIYWKPSFIWRVKRIRVMNPIRSESIGVRPIKYRKGGNDLAFYNYLKDVAYQVEVEYRWNHNRKDLENDWDYSKHNSIIRRMIEKGGRRDIFLGTRECQGYVEPSQFGEGAGFYDGIDEISQGIMFHSFIYPDEVAPLNSEGELRVNLWHCSMKEGIITFPDPEECTMNRVIYNTQIKSFIPGQNIEIVGDYSNELD